MRCAGSSSPLTVRRPRRHFNAGLIVIGNRPAMKVDRLFRGSTRDDIVKRSAVPVLLTSARPDTPAELPPRCIVLPAADVPQNAPAGRLARNLARLYDAEVVSNVPTLVVQA
jgi:hypothetical protein